MTLMGGTRARRGATRFTASLCAVFATASAAFSSEIAVKPNVPAPNRWTISSPTYRMVINLDSPRIDSFEAGGYALVPGGLGLAPTINTGAPWGPAKASVALTSPALTHVVMHGMRWEDTLRGAIEVHFFCYPDRVAARMDIIPHAPPPTLLLGWHGAVTQAGPFPDKGPEPDWHDVFGVKGALEPAALLLRPIRKGPDRERGAHIRIDRGTLVSAHYVFNSHDIGTRSISCTLVAARDEASLVQALESERAAASIECSINNGRYLGYDRQSGLHRFIEKPGPEPTSITVPGRETARTTQMVASVFALSRESIHVDGAGQPVAVHWMPRRFTASQTDGPGAYVFVIELADEPKTLTLTADDAGNE